MAHTGVMHRRRWLVWLLALAMLYGQWTVLRIARHFYFMSPRPLEPRALALLRVVFAAYAVYVLVMARLLPRLLEPALAKWRAQGTDGEERLILALLALLSSIGLSAVVLMSLGAPRHDAALAATASLAGLLYCLWRYRGRFFLATPAPISR
jgi:hypothetical protein